MALSEADAAREREHRLRAEERVGAILGSAEDRAARVEPGHRSRALAAAFEVPGPGAPRTLQDAVDEYVAARWQDRLGLTRGFEHVREVAADGSWGAQVACVRQLYREVDHAIVGDRDFGADVADEVGALCRKAGATEFDMAMVQVKPMATVVDVLHRPPTGRAASCRAFRAFRLGRARSTRRPGIPTSRSRPGRGRRGSGRRSGRTSPARIGRCATAVWRYVARPSFPAVLTIPPRRIGSRITWQLVVLVTLEGHVPPLPDRGGRPRAIGRAVARSRSLRGRAPRWVSPTALGAGALGAAEKGRVWRAGSRMRRTTPIGWSASTSWSASTARSRGPWPGSTRASTS